MRKSMRNHVAFSYKAPAYPEWTGIQPGLSPHDLSLSQMDTVPLSFLSLSYQNSIENHGFGNASVQCELEDFKSLQIVVFS